MPSHSAAQHKLMEIAAHTKGGFGEVPQKVGKEFVRADDSVYKKEFPFVQTDLEPEDIEDCMGLITDDGVLVDEYLSPNISITKDGYLWCENAVIARTGIQEYTDAELDMKSKSGKINLVRSKAEVFKPESLASFENKPITNRHPPEMVTSSNWSKYAKGSVHNVRQDGGLVRANLLITDAATIKEVQEQGLRKLSCGYYSILNELGNDTAEQTNIIINHLALVTNPRAGDICSIKDEQTINTKKEQDKKMTDNTDTFILGLKRFFKIVDAVNEKADKELEDEVGGDIDLGIGVQDADVAHESNEIKVETDIITMLNGIIKRLEALEEADKKELTDVCMEDDSTEDVVTDENTISETENTIGDALNTIISKAEILVPGFNKQFKGSSKETINTNTIKRQALKQAFLTDSVLLQPLVDGSIDEISDESLKVVFNAAVVLKTNKNNSLIKPTVILDSPRTPNAVEQHKAYFEQHNPK